MERVCVQVLDTPRGMAQVLFCLRNCPSAFAHRPTLDAWRRERQRRRRRHQKDSCCLDRFAQIIQKYLEAQFASVAAKGRIRHQARVIHQQCLLWKARKEFWQPKAVANHALLQFPPRSDESCRHQKPQPIDWHTLWHILFVFRTRDLLCEYYTNCSVFLEHDS